MKKGNRKSTAVKKKGRKNHQGFEKKSQANTNEINFSELETQSNDVNNLGIFEQNFYVLLSNTRSNEVLLNFFSNEPLKYFLKLLMKKCTFFEKFSASKRFVAKFQRQFFAIRSRVKRTYVFHDFHSSAWSEKVF